MESTGIFCDGGYSPVYNRGMWCYKIDGCEPQYGVLFEDDYGNLTSNMMEYIAIEEALKSLNNGVTITIYSDSQIAIKQLTKSWNIYNGTLHELCIKIWKLIHDKGIKAKFRWISRDENPAGHFIELHGKQHIGRKYGRDRRNSGREDDW